MTSKLGKFKTRSSLISSKAVYSDLDSFVQGFEYQTGEKFEENY